MNEENRQFHWADYVVFSMALLLSAAIGVYFAFVGRKSQNSKDFLVGGQQMRSFPVALSLLASFLSAPAIIGTPTEIYYYGMVYLYILISYSIACLITANTFLPVFHKMQLTSAYEYLETRYNKVVRLLGSITFSVMMLFYMGISIYAPAAAFSQVTGLSEVVSVLAVGLICTFYTSVGGMKAVIWTDVLQMGVILGGMLLLVILGSIDGGGISAVWNSASESGRFNFNLFQVDPRVRYSFWTQVVGTSFIALSILGSNQAMIQRYLSIKKLSDARKSLFYALLVMILYFVLAALTGILLTSKYSHCDAMLGKFVKKADQIVPLYIMEVFGKYHGLPGLFSAAIFSATLSTVSSGLNALAAVTLCDFYRPAFKLIKGRDLDEKWSTIISKLTACFLGLVTIGVAYLSPYLGSTLLQIALSIFGMVGGPLLGLFSLAVFIPCSNKWGAAVGLITSLIFSFWIAIGAAIHSKPPPTLPVDISQCTNTTNTMVALVQSYDKPAIATEAGIAIYDVSYTWYAMYSVIVCIITGTIVSAITGFNNGEEVDRKLVFNWKEIFPGGSRLCAFCPITPDTTNLTDDKEIVPHTNSVAPLQQLQGTTENPLNDETSKNHYTIRL